MHIVLPLLFILFPTIGWLIGWPWLTLVVSALLLPLIEWVCRDVPAKRTLAWGETWPRLLMALIVAQTLLMGALVQSMSWPMLLLMGLSVGYVSGGSGIVLAHELGHRKPLIDRGLSRLLLLTVAYGHYAIEHNRGHHRTAATYPDPATARFEESLWRFLPRYYSGVWQDALKLSRQQPGRFNEALALMCTTLSMFIAIYLIADIKSLVFMLIQAMQAQLLVGAVDYMEHWGLQRADQNGKPERMGPQHTWDCANVVSDTLLFNLPRHSSHHLQPSLSADELFHVPDSPQMPTGYAGMVVLTMVPPLYRRVMTSRLPQHPA